MATDLNKKRRIPVLPSSRALRERLEEIRRDAEKLELMLKLANEMEAVDKREPAGK